ncbi:hypothetical protein FPANT_6543, partial [Fusarium pseudoanthophilum]
MGYVLLAPYNDSMHLGQGFNSFLQRPCIDGAVKLTQADLQTEAARAGSPSNVSQVVSYSSRLVEKISDVVRGMNISAASSIKLGTIQVSGNSLSVDEAKFAASDMNAVISVKVINQITSAIKNPPLSVVSMAYCAPPLTTGAMNGSAGEFTLSEGTASSTIEAAVQETESTVTVNWSGGGQIKNDDAEWTLASLISAASAFPGRVAACPHKTYAILTPYNRNRSFVEWAEQNNITVPDFSPVQQYTHDLLDSFMEFKSILGRIQAVLANPLAYRPSSSDNAVSVDVESLVLERQKIKKEMVKIGNIVDKLLVTPNSNPSTLVTEEVDSPEVWAARLPVLVESTMVNNKLTALETADVISGFYNNDPTHNTAEPEIPASLGSKMNDSMKTVQDATKEKEKEIEKETPVVEICSASIKASLTQQERAFVDSEFNKRKYSQYRFGDLVGVPGGGFFVDTLFLEQAIEHVSWPDRIEILLQDLNDSRVYAVRVTYQQTQESHGKNMGETVDSTFIDLEEGEVVNEVTLGRRDTTGVAFIRLRTSKNSETRIGTLKDCVEVTKCVPYDGCTGLKGFWGGSGDLVDRLGPIWAFIFTVFLPAWADPTHWSILLLTKFTESLYYTSISCRHTGRNMSWIVENFQVPVPLGDCSIHVLIDNRTSVKYAFIMDGGVDSGGYSASKAITKTVVYVNQYLLDKYRIETKIKFNLWVVTHWDADHFRGVMDLIKEGVEPPKRSKWMIENFVKVPTLYCGRLEEPFISQISSLRFKFIGGEMTLGFDMLSGVQIFDQNGTPMSNKLKERRPRFCIVGADGYGISVPRFQEEVTRNQSSILAVLFWPWPCNDGRCCFFAGGDGNPEMERQIISKFLKVNTFARLDDGLDLMKLDHHGSSQEGIYGGDLREIKSKRKMKLADMPIGLFKPKNFLVTPGNLHGHPTYDVVHCLLEILGSTTRLSKEGRPEGRVWTTRSPYWATKQPLTTKDLSAYHNKDLKEIHKKDFRAYKDPAKKELKVGMLLALEAQGSSKALDRANALKVWKKRILQQAVILEEKNLTEYQIEQQAKKELEAMMENIHKNKPTMAVEEEKDQRKQEQIEEEAVASAQFDYEYVSYDDVMNLRFAGHEMWNLICDQGIVPATQDPFFIVHFRWVDAKFRPVVCLDMDGKPKDYKPEPSVPRRYSQRLQDIREAKRQKILDLLVTKAKELEIKEKSLVNPIMEQDRFFEVEEDQGFFAEDNYHEKGQDGEVSLLMFDLSIPIGQFRDQAFLEQNKFTHISRMSGVTATNNFTGTDFGAFSTLQSGRTTLQPQICPVASLATSMNQTLSYYGFTIADLSSDFKTNVELERWAAAFQLTSTKGTEPDPNSRSQLDYGEDEGGDISFKEEADKDFVLDDFWEDKDVEIDNVLESLEALRKEYREARLLKKN